MKMNCAKHFAQTFSLTRLENQIETNQNYSSPKRGILVVVSTKVKMNYLRRVKRCMYFK